MIPIYGDYKAISDSVRRKKAYNEIAFDKKMSSVEIRAALDKLPKAFPDSANGCFIWFSYQIASTIALVGGVINGLEHLLK